MAEQRSPQVDRPTLPEDYRLPEQETGLLPWVHAQGRLGAARIYWVATCYPDGRPHITPIWGVWMEDRFYFDGSPATRRARNLAQNPAITIHLNSDEVGQDVVIVNGEAHELKAPALALRERLAAHYGEKYASEGYEPGPETWAQGGLYEMRPRTALAWNTLFKDATRWTF